MSYTPFIWPLLLSALILAGLGAYARRHWEVWSTRLLLALCVWGAAWAILAALDIMTYQLDWKIFWVNLRTIPIGLTAPTFLALAFDYTGSRFWLTRWRVLLVLIEPAIVIILAFTSAFHHLYRYNFRVDIAAGFPVLLVDRGPLYWVHMAYNGSLLLFTFGILINAFRSHRTYFAETIYIGIGCFLPWTVDLLFNLGITPIRGYNLTPSTFIVSGLLYAWLIIRFRAFAVTPVARNIVFENIEDLVVVLDKLGHIVDFNQAARSTLGLTEAVIGKLAEEFEPDWARLFSGNASNSKTEVQVGSGEYQKIFERTIKVVQDSHQHSLGQLFLFHEITSRKRADETLRQFSQVIEQSPASVIITNNEGVITYVNGRFTQVTGYSSSEVIGQTPRILKSGFTPEAQYLDLWQTILRGVEWKGDFLNRRKDGSFYWESALIAPVKGPLGEITHFLALKEDISGQKRVEKLQQTQRNLALALAATHTLSEAAACVLEHICETIEIDSGLVYRCLVATSGEVFTTQFEKIGDHGLSTAFLDAFNLTQEQIFVRFNGDPQIPQYCQFDDLLEGSISPALAKENLQSTVLLPVYYESQFLAFVMLFSHTCNEFYAETRFMLDSLSAQMGAVIARLTAEQALLKVNLDLERQVKQRTAELQTIVKNLEIEIAERQRVETTLRKAEQRLAERVADQSRKLAMLYEVILVSGQSLTMPEILERTMAKFIDVMSCDAVSLHQWHQHNKELSLFAQRGISPADQEQLNLLEQKQIPEDGIPWMTNSRLGSEKAIPACLRLSGFEAFLGIPIHLHNETVGFLSAFWRQAAHLSVEDIALFSAIADQLAILLENVRLRLLSEEVGARQERRRLARDLHDSVTQSLHSLVLAADTARNRLAKGDRARLASSLDLLEDSARQALKEMRLMLYELRLSPSESMNFVDALQARLELVEQRAGILTNLVLEGEPGWPVVWEKDLYAIAIEALNNILRHSKAAEVDIHILGGEGLIELEIKDYGCGMELDKLTRSHQPDRQHRSGGIGLSTMQERAEKLGGTFEIQSSPGKGTCVCVRIPGGGD